MSGGRVKGSKTSLRFPRHVTFIFKVSFFNAECFMQERTVPIVSCQFDMAMEQGGFELKQTFLQLKYYDKKNPFIDY